MPQSEDPRRHAPGRTKGRVSGVPGVSIRASDRLESSSSDRVARKGCHAEPGLRDGLDCGVRADERLADAVLGQPDFPTAIKFPYRPQGPSAFRLPYGVAGRGRSLFVADTSNKRGVVDDLAATVGEMPMDGTVDWVLGQHDFEANGENRWDTVAADSFCWPYGIAVDEELLAVADSGNNRVTLWRVPS